MVFDPRRFSLQPMPQQTRMGFQAQPPIGGGPMVFDPARFGNLPVTTEQPFPPPRPNMDAAVAAAAPRTQTARVAAARAQPAAVPLPPPRPDMPEMAVATNPASAGAAPAAMPLVRDGGESAMAPRVMSKEEYQSRLADMVGLQEAAAKNEAIYSPWHGIAKLAGAGLGAFGEQRLNDQYRQPQAEARAGLDAAIEEERARLRAR